MQESKRILFVDDDVGWRLVVRDCLEDAGFDVVTAADGTEAMAAADGLKLDLIILDLNLGGENGFQLMKVLKQNYPEVPFLLYTGMSQAEVAAQAIPQEAHQPYVRKSTMERLLASVRDALAKKKSSDEL